MNKIGKLLVSIVLALSLVGCNTSDVKQTSSAAPTDDANASEIVKLKVLAPKGATALPFAKIMADGTHDVTTVDGADLLQSSLVSPNSEYDVIVAPTNLGVKLISANKSNYRLLDVLTWGNLYLVAKNGVELTDGSDIALFGENAVVGLVFEDLFGEMNLNKTYYNSVQDAQIALLSGNTQIALLAQPAASAAIAKAKENGKELSIIGNIQELWEAKYGDSYPQASIFVSTDAIDNKLDSVISLIDDISSFVEEANNDTQVIANYVDTVKPENLGVPNANIAMMTWDSLNIKLVRGFEVIDQLNNFLKLFNVEDASGAVLEY